MGLFGKLFGKKSGDATPPAAPPGGSAPAVDDTILVYDEDGREIRIAKREWLEKVLPGNLEKSRDDPDKLYALLAQSLEDGFANELIPYAEHLASIDPQHWRGATLLGVVYLQTDRVDDARRTLQSHLERHGANGYVLTNLAKVFWKQGDEAQGDATLWQALQADPNQKNALDLYFSGAARTGGEPAAWEATRRVAALPGSWLAQSWLAWADVDAGRHAEGVQRYREVLKITPRPAPTDLLVKMSGVLGSNGLLAELLELTGPLFDPRDHGLQVGANLMQANLGLGRVDAAAAILDELSALKRPDYRASLGEWEAEIARSRK